MDFNERLQKAVQRGHHANDEKADALRRQKIDEEDFKRLHSQYRLSLSEHIEKYIAQLPDHFPGFQYETIVSERGWGAAVSRDDVGLGRKTFYSRLEIVVKPYSTYHVLELATKGTIRNKELFNRNHFEKLEDVDQDEYIQLIDRWILEYAELYARNT